MTDFNPERLTDRIMGALRQGRATGRLIAHRIGVSHLQVVTATLNNLALEKRIVRIGTVFQARVEGIDIDEIDRCISKKYSRADAGVYALLGTPILVALVPDIQTTINAAAQLPKKPKGNVAGRILIRGFYWPRVGGFRGRSAE